MDAREALIEAGATEVKRLAKRWRWDCDRDLAFECSRNVIDAALSATFGRPCETCGGPGLKSICPTCHGAGTIPGGWAIIDVLVERGVLEQVGWQYAHDHNGPLANLRQAAACADTVPVYRVVVPEEKP